MAKEPRGDAAYWAKLAVEEILHYFGIPEEHDESCFFHAKGFGKGTVEDCRRDYCPKCREFLLQLNDPLDFDKLLARVENLQGEHQTHPQLEGEFKRLFRSFCSPRM